MIVYPGLGHHGRLANQLWEIAGTAGLAVSHGQECAFPTDWSYRPWFSVPDAMFSDEAGTNVVELVTDVDERHRIYLQDHRYWRAIDWVIRQWFAPSPAALEILYRPELDWFHDLPDKIAVHVRRGDFLETGPAYNPMPALGYYRRALELLPGHPVVVFSDEISWCRRHLPAVAGGREMHFFEGVTRPKAHELGYEAAPVLDWLDLQLMANCTGGHVIANSSYSWWGAWLSEDPMLLYPDVWHGPALLAYADPKPMFIDPRWRAVEASP